MSELYPDTNGNGIPDVFESRRPISEILAEESLDTSFATDYAVLEVEWPRRRPQRGELIIVADEIIRAGGPYSSGMDFLVVKRIVSGTPEVKS